VPDQIDIAYRLNAHHAKKHPLFLEAPELDPSADLRIEFRPGHVRFVPAIGRYHPPVSLGGGIDDLVQHLPLVLPT